MAKLIFAYKLIFLVVTHLVAAIALISIFTDVAQTTRLFWIAAALSCIGVVTTWDKQYENNSTGSLTN